MTARTWECWDFPLVYRHPDGRIEPVVWCLRCLVRRPKPVALPLSTRHKKGPVGPCGPAGRSTAYSSLILPLPAR
jgi:hypothetical protein